MQLSRARTMDGHESLMESDDSQDVWDLRSAKLDFQYQDAFRGVSCDIARCDRNFALSSDKQTLEAQRNWKITALLSKWKRKN